MAENIGRKHNFLMILSWEGFPEIQDIYPDIYHYVARPLLSEVYVAQLCSTLCDPMDYIPPSSSLHGIFQARILKCFAIPFSRGLSPLRDPIQITCIAGRFVTI